MGIEGINIQLLSLDLIREVTASILVRIEKRKALN